MPTQNATERNRMLFSSFSQGYTIPPGTDLGGPSIFRARFSSEGKEKTGCVGASASSQPIKRRQ
ncbi:uncharacterized protein CTRU02_211130 [Colletotrichum truncatum]|uniref:Uncharacterized protein n=1 Tax=Colletotrichum truncatum TaxID=5467 RepID=A0ACC3YR35_COLTU|nr:uncharacterized protein CTRU02_01911 [Colletotrichum truncatum]KAF6799040.1 hypothetical protein CTRU02_01911 [Colletotrichum truncatum]